MRKMTKASWMAAIAGVTAAAIAGGALVAGADDLVVASAGDDNYELSEEAIVSDWCGFVGDLIGPGRSVVSVRAVVDAAAAGDATTTDGVNPETARDPDAAVAAAYLSLLEGEPDAIAAPYATVRAAVTAAVEGEPVPDEAAATAAADAIDRFRSANCSSAG